MRPIRTVCTLLWFFAILAGLAAAQTEDPDQPVIPTFKTRVNVVSLVFRVKNERGTFVPNLTRDDFQVFEDGELQTIKFFNANTELPLTVAVLIDSSRSQGNLLPMEQEIAGSFLAEVLEQQDSAFIVGFDLDAEVVQDSTNSPFELRTALDHVKVNEPNCNNIPGMGTGPLPSECRGGTVLYDAIYLAAQEKLRKEDGRKAMVILTDGQDEGSKMKIRQAIEAVQKADCVVYVLLIANKDFYASYGYRGDIEMKKICDETGGRMIVVGNSDQKMREAFDQIAAEMRSQYSIGYTPTNRRLDGSFRKIEIKTKDIYKIQARDGYFAQSTTPHAPDDPSR